jgi:hypothetical protein
VVAFDPLEHGMPPSVIPATDTSQLLGLIVAKRLDVASVAKAHFLLASPLVCACVVKTGLARFA